MMLTLHPKNNVVAAVIAGAALAMAPDAGADRGPVRPKLSDPNRTVHRFDFDERAEGNLESVPKFWTPLRMRGFPVFASGAFDFDRGHVAPPSFRLDSSGRNIAYEYTGPATAVRPFVDYSVEAFVRTAGMRTSRAALSAHYLDQDGHVVSGSIVRSEFVGANEDWAPVRLYLSHAPPTAKGIGLIAWVLQESNWYSGPYPSRHIPRVDVEAAAWFDDIVVRSLPIAKLATSQIDNVLGPAPSTQELQIVFAHVDARGLDGVLQIANAAGKVVEQHSLDATHGGDVLPTTVPVGHLAPGLYRAVFTAYDQDAKLLTRHLDFVVLSKSMNGTVGTAPRVGLVLDPDVRADAVLEASLIRKSGAGAVKVPLWSGSDDNEESAGSTAGLVQMLAKRGIAQTAMLVGRTPDTADDLRGRSQRTIELLAGDPATWRDRLAARAVPLADVFSWWQLGWDGDRPNGDPDVLLAASQNLQDALHGFLTNPRIQVPVHEHDAPDLLSALSGQRTIALVAGHHDGLDAPGLAQRRLDSGDVVSVYIPIKSPAGYIRLPRVAAWARRVIGAVHAGADVTYVDTPWSNRQTVYGIVTEPTEEFVVVRTITAMLGGATPGPRMTLPNGVEVFSFYRGDYAILAVWDYHAGMEGRRRSLPRGFGERQMDLWGNTQALHLAAGGRLPVTVSAVPTLLLDANPSLIDFLSSIQLTPESISTGQANHHHPMTLTLRVRASQTGTIRLSAPRGWEISPREIAIVPGLRPVRSYDVDVRRPHNVPAGTVWFGAGVVLAAPDIAAHVRLPVNVSLHDLDVWASVSTEAGRLVISHTITNRSDSVLHLRATAQVPNRERQYRPIAELRPGQTQTVKYGFRDVPELSGAGVRVSIQELPDGPRTHTMELVVP